MKTWEEFVKAGGRWLGSARAWIQRKKLNGSRVTWGSGEALEPPVTVREIEDLSANAAYHAYQMGYEDGRRHADLQIAALRKALYAECMGSDCDTGNCCGGYRKCSGCERRAKEAYGPGWGDFTEKRKCPYNHSDHKIEGFLPVQNCPNCSS